MVRGVCQDRHHHHRHPSLSTSLQCPNSFTGMISFHHHDPLQQVPLLSPCNDEGKSALETLITVVTQVAGGGGSEASLSDSKVLLLNLSQERLSSK